MRVCILTGAQPRTDHMICSQSKSSQNVLCGRDRREDPVARGFQVLFLATENFRQPKLTSTKNGTDGAEPLVEAPETQGP